MPIFSSVHLECSPLCAALNAAPTVGLPPLSHGSWHLPHWLLRAKFLEHPPTHTYPTCSAVGFSFDSTLQIWPFLRALLLEPGWSHHHFLPELGPQAPDWAPSCLHISLRAGQGLTRSSHVCYLSLVPALLLTHVPPALSLLMYSWQASATEPL